MPFLMARAVYSDRLPGRSRSMVLKVFSNLSRSTTALPL